MPFVPACTGVDLRAGLRMKLSPVLPTGEDFRCASEHVLRKNCEMYRRLAYNVVGE